MKPSLASAPTVITCHSNADWDALSSMIGMSMIYPDTSSSTKPPYFCMPLKI